LKKSYIIICILLAVVLTGCAVQVDEAVDVRTEVMYAQWPSYTDAESLISDSENIIVGKVKEQLPYVERNIGLYADVFTPFEIAVSDVIKGNTAAETVTVIQRGGMSADGKTFYVVNEMPLLEEGEEYLLFMTPADDDGYFGLYPPCVGYIKVEDGKLIFGEDKNNLFSDEDEAELEQVINKIKKTLDDIK